MDQAKAAVSDFLKNSGHHNTTVHETVAPAVTHETVSPHRHENVTTVLDREVHQDHYHTTVQPIQDRQILPEQHHHNVVPVEHRSFEHDDKSQVERRLAQEAAQFKDLSITNATTETHEVRPQVAGEHIHHHVHENIQPVVHRETIQPHVVHTTVPVHEVHHNAAQHHTTSSLPAMSMSDFKKQGGILTGREERYDGFEGEPRHIGKTLGSEHHHGHHGTGVTGTTGTTGTTGLGHSSSTTGTTGLGHHNSTGLGHRDTTGTTGLGHRDTTDSTGLGHRDTTGSTGLGHSSSTTGTTGLGNTSSSHDNEKVGVKKASLMDKINPKIDSDGDGKAGFMK